MEYCAGGIECAGIAAEAAAAAAVEASPLAGCSGGKAMRERYSGGAECGGDGSWRDGGGGGAGPPAAPLPFKR